MSAWHLEKLNPAAQSVESLGRDSIMALVAGTFRGMPSRKPSWHTRGTSNRPFTFFPSSSRLGT